jgi:Cu(I)/Ag(I) efflux system membrane fusion protein
MSLITENIKRFWNSSHRWPVLIALFIGLMLGLLISGGGTDHSIHDHEAATTVEKKGEIWTCSMHPQIRQPKPGKCPICGMDLILATSGAETSSPGELKLSAHAVKLAEIQVKSVERRFVANEIRMVGKIEYDETRLGYITSRVSGRIDRLYVDYTGTPVRKGDHLVYLYSPDLIIAQKELQQAVKTLKRMESRANSTIKKTAERTVSAAREKLRLWGLTSLQIKDIEKMNKPNDHLTIYSPMKGIVIHKHALEGIYVKTGTRIYTIADLSQVWVKLDAYESDLPWIRYGQVVEFEVEAYPGEIFKGKISFIDPVLNPKTRTVKVRVNVKNTAGKLKPEMFVRAIVRSRLSMSGKVMDPDLAGKWISPMHPEIVKDKPGKCDICGMPLVRAEKLGYVAAREENREAPLVIPASAPLITGTRAVVYLAVPGKEGTFIGRQITLGPRAGDYYLVTQGLKVGEQVVVNGAFKIDSDLQIQAQPSMMNPEGGVIAQGHEHLPATEMKHQQATSKSLKQDSQKVSNQKSFDIPKSFKQSIDVMTESYFDIHQALSSDNLGAANKSAQALLKKLTGVDMNLLKGDAHMEWMKFEGGIKKASQKLAKDNTIETARRNFEELTAVVTGTIKTFGSGKGDIYRFHCPMAFNNKGAFWLQKSSDTRNPYFGAAMLTCKDSVEKLKSAKK